jgi:hypothetical protein
MTGVMLLPLREWRFFFFVLAVTSVVSSASAVVIESREYHGKQVQCMHGGNWLNRQQFCGTQGYARVFTGTVKSAIEISDTEKRLEIIPDESFLGEPVSEVTATVNQACLPEVYPEIQPGDKWLFYLRYDAYIDGGYIRSKKGLVLSFDSPSKPVSQAQDDIETLRHLARLTDKSILTGNVTRVAGGNWDTAKIVPVPGHKIVARRASDGIEFTALTNASGYYEFELPPDSYIVGANTKPGLKTQEEDPRIDSIENNAQLWKGQCVSVGFLLRTDGRLSGRITTAAGKPASNVRVAIVPISPVAPQFTVTADEDGHFEAVGRQPGSYLVGVGLLAPFVSPEWQSRVYYPGVPTREQAKVIELDDGEWRTDIDFTLLPTFTVP